MCSQIFVATLQKCLSLTATPSPVETIEKHSSHIHHKLKYPFKHPNPCLLSIEPNPFVQCHQTLHNYICMSLRTAYKKALVSSRKNCYDEATLQKRIPRGLTKPKSGWKKGGKLQGWKLDYLLKLRLPQALS